MTSDRELHRAALDAEARSTTIGHALARSREARGWSRDELADWLGVTPPGLAAIALEPMPTHEITRRSGVLYPAATVFVLADRYGAYNDRLLEAIGEA